MYISTIIKVQKSVKSTSNNKVVDLHKHHTCEDRNVVCVQALAPLKTRAKDDMGKTYWIYPDEKEVNFFEQKIWSWLSSTEK